MLAMLVCGAVQMAAVCAVASSWWVPNLVLAAMVQAIHRRPARWPALGILGGALLAGWAARGQGTVVAGCVLAAWLVRRWLGMVDAGGLRAQQAATAAAALALTLWGLAVDRLWSATLVGLAAAHVALTVLAVPLVRRLAAAGGRHE
jgi:hypothetical protein